MIDGRDFQDLLFNTHRGEFHRLDLSVDFPENSSPDLGFSADGTELWAVESSELTLHRYALP